MLALIVVFGKFKRKHGMFWKMNLYFKQCGQTIAKVAISHYRESPPYTHFGTWKKLCYMKFVLVGLAYSPLLLHVHKPKTVLVETVLVIFV